MSARHVEAAATLPPDTAAPIEVSGLKPGQIVDGRYRLLEKLGEGGMGAVFLAEHLTLHKQVALKTIHAALEGHAEVAARFAREAMVSARIEHPHVVSALDYGRLEDGAAYLVMQLARGESLRQRLEREHALAWPLACELIGQMADAVAAAHATGIVHRDLKPENVILEPREGDALHLKVLDFGIAHLRAGAEATLAPAPGRVLTQLGVVMGTPGYMSPEQAVGQPVDERTDIYALGVMLWELLAGRPPFEGQTLTEIITKQFAAEPPSLPSDAQAVPAPLRAYLAQMLASQADARPQSAAEVRDRMRELRHRASSPASKALIARDVLRSVLAISRRYIDRTPSVRDLLTTGRRRFHAAPTEHKLLAGLALLVALLWGALSVGSQTETVASPSRQTEQASPPRRKGAVQRSAEAREEAAAPEATTREDSPRAKSSQASGGTRLRNRLRAIFR